MDNKRYVWRVIKSAMAVAMVAALTVTGMPMGQGLNSVYADEINEDEVFADEVFADEADYDEEYNDEMFDDEVYADAEYDFEVNADELYADGEKTISGLGTGAIANPNSINGKGWSYVWYGCIFLNGRNGPIYVPNKCRVLSNCTTEYGGKTMLLDSDENDGTGRNFLGSKVGTWADSQMRNSVLNGVEYLEKDYFTAQEKKTIANSYKNISGEYTLPSGKKTDKNSFNR